jgi:uncharacterized protein (TIGR01777 family)
MSGATGLIGKEIAKRLVAGGHEITALVRDVDRARDALPMGTRLVKWASGDVVSPEAMEGVDAVINLAGESIAGGRWTAKRKKRIRDSRVLTTRALVNATLQHPEVKVFVSGSAVGFYGDRGDGVLDEASSRGSGFLAEVVAEWEAELKALDVARVRAVAVRTAVVFSPRGGALEKLLPLFRAGLGGRLGDGRQWMSWIHIDDIARLFVFALENDAARGAVNGSAPQPVRNDQFTRELARALSRPAFLPVPRMALRLALGEMATSVLDSQRVLPRRAEELGFRFEHPEIAEALRSIRRPV